MLKIVFSEDYKNITAWSKWWRRGYFRALQDVLDLTQERDEARDLARKFHTQLERKICKC